MRVSMSGDEIKCAECGADRRLDATKCWLCGADLTVDFVTAEIIPDPPGAPQQAAQFTIAGALVTTTLIAVLLGVWVEEPGTAMLLTIVAVPALIATYVRTARKRSAGKPMGWGAKIATFFVAAAAVYGTMMLLAVAAVAALFIYCMIDPPSF